jgi:hypothetical protein
MLGLATTRREWLTAEERGVLCASYCGLCHSLRTGFGSLAAVFLNYEAQFLAIITSAQREQLPNLTQTRCPFNAFLKRVPVLDDHDASKFAAAATMLLISERLRDNLRDENHLGSKILLRLFRAQIRKARQVFLSMGFPCEYLDISTHNQRLVEAGNSPDLRACLEPTAFLVGEIFAHTGILANVPSNSYSLRSLGRAVGSLVTLTDACQDLYDDRLAETYNPISACWQLHDNSFVPIEALAEVCAVITEQLHQIRVCLNDLCLPNFARLVENFLTEGMPFTVRQALARLWGENHWTGHLPLRILALSEQELCAICGMPHSCPAKVATLCSNYSCDSQSLWTVASLVPTLTNLAQELGFADEKQYMLACILPLLTTHQEESRPTGIVRWLRLI